MCLFLSVITAVAFWTVGFAFAFGNNFQSIFGLSYWGLGNVEAVGTFDRFDWMFWMFQVTFPTTCLFFVTILIFFSTLLQLLWVES